MPPLLKTLTKPRAVMVDAHVHFHGCYDLDTFLNGAFANFERAAEQVGCTTAWTGCLLLADTACQHSLRRFVETARGKSIGRWGFRNTAEDCSLLACRDSEVRLIVVAGRQIVSSEGIELLALGCNRAFPDGLPLRESLEAVRQCEAIPVLPWGFGKWWFRRGTVVAELLKSFQDHRVSRHPKVFLGDNAGRPRLSWDPRLFKAAEEQGVWILPGSDPLPFPSQVTKAGRYGFILQGRLDRDKPAEGVKKLLRENTDQPQTYGRREGLTNFLRYQIASRLPKAST